MHDLDKPTHSLFSTITISIVICVNFYSADLIYLLEVE